MTELKLINQEITKDTESSIGYNYKSYSVRINDILKELESWKHKKLSTFLNFPVFNIPNSFKLNDGFDSVDGIELSGIYDIKPISQYIGYIPHKNQLEINNNIKTIKENPFIDSHEDYEEYCFILAPKNNFETTNNISGIDPIVFYRCKINNEKILIPVTQWD